MQYLGLAHSGMLHENELYIATKVSGYVRYNIRSIWGMYPLEKILLTIDHTWKIMTSCIEMLACSVLLNLLSFDSESSYLLIREYNSFTPRAMHVPLVGEPLLNKKMFRGIFSQGHSHVQSRGTPPNTYYQTMPIL